MPGDALSLACWRCEQPGHAAADCQPEPAATRKELAERVNRLVERWIAGGITTSQKREWIRAELKMFPPKEKAK
jgi:hypothetical protein